MTGLLFKRDEANKGFAQTPGEYHFGLKWGEKVERAALFRFISPLRVGRPFQGERREVQTPPLCEYRLPMEYGWYDLLPSPHISTD